jgi:uncharacterized protein (DUF1778 family)
MKRLVIDLPDWLHKRIKAAANLKEMYIRQFVLDAITQEIDQMSDRFPELNVHLYKPKKVRFPVAVTIKQTP